MSLVKPKPNFEKVVLILLALSFIIGIWYALPIINVVGDEMHFVGGVLRAMQNHTIFPVAGDVPYGTLTYLLNYILIGFLLLILLPFFGFNLINLKLFLIESPELVYLWARFLSVALAIIYLLLINKILKKEIQDLKTRLFLLVLLFSNMLVSLILHTGKVWVLSTLLVLISFYYLYQALNSKTLKSIFLTIFFGFLAFANFQICGFALINVPLLFIFFWHDKQLKIKIFKYVLIGLVVFILITSLNLATLKAITLDVFASSTYNSSASGFNLWPFWLIFKRLMVACTLLLLTLILVIKDKIKNKDLFIISFVYFLTYYISLSLVTSWPSHLYSDMRHIFPLGFFLILIIASFNIKFKRIFYLIGFVSIVYFIFTLHHLSVPTTANQAYNWAVSNLNQPDIIIINDIWEIQFLKNKDSYLLTQDYYCASKCQNVIEHDLNNHFKSIIIDEYTQPDIELPDNFNTYYFKYEPQDRADWQLINSFGNSDRQDLRIDLQMVNYLDFNLFKNKNFGPDIYIYQQI